MTRVFLAVATVCATLLMPPLGASAQVVRVDRTDKMTDRRIVFLVAPAHDGRSAFFVNCSGYSVRSYELAALPGRVKLLTRIDRNSPMPADGEVKPPETLTFAPANADGFATELSAARRLVVRIEGGTAKEFDFDWSSDHKEAFAAAAEAAGGDRLSAGFGYEILTGGASRAAAGQYPTLASLLNAIGVKWRDAGRPLDTGAYIGGVMDVMRRSPDRRQVEDAGNVLFGPSWTAIRGLVQHGAPVSYTDLNRPMAVQISWLRRNCPSS
jgi:hypothetical protein